ncbi:MAG: GTP-binding protein, partial [Planctomycetota bacterium]
MSAGADSGGVAGRGLTAAHDAAGLRNVGICAHIDAGKTTLTERILFLTGVERYVGRVDEGTSVMDWMTEERERGITITAATTRVPWRGAEINLVDTPGHVDFTVEVERCMRVLDGAIVVLDGTKGVEPQTETVWRQVERRGLPAIAFANKCERPGADVLRCAEDIAERFGRRAVVVAYPIGGGDTDAPLTGVVDLVHMRAQALDAAGQRTLSKVPRSVADEAAVLRAELVDALAEVDEGLFAVVCEGRTPTSEELLAALRAQTLARTVVPLFAGAALMGHGVALLLDGVASVLPSPSEGRPPDLFHVASGEPFDGSVPELLALNFKVHSKVRRGERSDLHFVRIYAGELGPGSRVWNGRTGHTERILAVLRIHASDVEHIERAGPGDVVALAGLRETGTGDTLTTEGADARLEPPTIPTPVLGYLVEPRSDEDREGLRAALEQLAREDPSLHASLDPESGQWLLEGMGELHLAIAMARLSDEFGVEPRHGPPRVALRESVRASAVGVGLVDRAYGDAWGNARVEIELEPEA